MVQPTPDQLDHLLQPCVTFYTWDPILCKGRKTHACMARETPAWHTCGWCLSYIILFTTQHSDTAYVMYTVYSAVLNIA